MHIHLQVKLVCASCRSGECRAVGRARPTAVGLHLLTPLYQLICSPIVVHNFNSAAPLIARGCDVAPVRHFSLFMIDTCT